MPHSSELPPAHSAISIHESPSPQNPISGNPVPIWPLVIIITTTLLPRELRLNIGDNYLYFDRIVILACLPWLAWELWRGTLKFVLPDWLVLIAGLWIIAATAAVYNINRAMISGVAIAFDMMALYFVARISIQSPHDFRRVLIYISPAFFVAGISLAIESLSHQLIIRPYFRSIFGEILYQGGGAGGQSQLRYDLRLGLLRAYGPWPHPILAGIHLAVLLPLYAMSGIRGWPRLMALAAALMSFFTISSAAFIGLGLGFFCLITDRLTQSIRELNWKFLLYVLLIALIIIQIFSNSGLINIIIRFGALDPHTGFFRQLIWQFGTISVQNHFWFGIGFEPYQRPFWMITNSIDNFWLLLAVRYGFLPAFCMFFAALLTIFALIHTASHTNPSDARFYRGLLFSLVIMVILAFTVTLSGGTLHWYSILMGSAVACTQRGFIPRKITP